MKKRMSEKEISFIIPVYNCKEYLQDSIESIQSIDTFGYEIILIDDGSTDGSGLICDDLASENANIICVHQQNQGVSVARNQGLKIASGEYIVFLDADDNIEIKKLVQLVRILEEDCTIDMAVYGLSFDFYYSGRQYRRDELAPSLNGEFSSDKWISKIPELYRCNSLSPIWNKVMKRSILIKHQLEFRRDMFLYEDLEFSLCCMAYCENIYFCSDIIYHYRQSEDEGNAGRRLRRIEYLSALIKQIEHSLDELIEQKRAEKYQSQIKGILFSLYLVLAREKIAVSDAAEIRQICDDFIIWFNERHIEIPAGQQKFVEQLLNRQVSRLIVDRTYTAVRHGIAVKVKNTRIYRKLRG